MYVVGKGHEHMGPGTSLVQRIDWNPSQEAQVRQGFGCGKGLGGCGCGGRCGLGLFESGFDFSQWSGVEWALVAIGGYMLLSTMFTTRRAARRVRSAVSGAYRGAQRANPGRRRRRR